MACIGGASYLVRVQNVSFIDSTSTSLINSTFDIYSDGSCYDDFWYSQSDCPGLTCSSCYVRFRFFVF